MDTIFLKMLNMSITAGFIVAAAAVLKMTFKKAPRWIYNILWGLAALRLVLPFSISSIYSVLPRAEMIPMDILADRVPAAANTAVIESAGIINDSVTESVNTIQGLIHIASYIWLAGILVMIVYGIYSYVRIRKLTKDSIPVEKGIRYSPNISTPFILGIFKPKIFIPPGLDGKDLEMVVEHERVHLKRKDYWIKPMGFVLLSIYWFNPVIWVAYILLCRDIEYACDEAVIRKLGNNEKKAYSLALLSCGSRSRLISACPLSFGETSVKGRVRNVLDYRKPSFWVIISAVLICIGLSLVFVTNPPDKSGDNYPVGTYIFDECIYISPLSSYFPFEDTGEIYILKEDGLVIQNKSTRKTNLNIETEISEPIKLRRSEWEDLNTFNFYTGMPEIKGYSTAVYWILSPDFRIYMMDDEIWLMRLSGDSGVWSIYRLEPADSEE